MTMQTLNDLYVSLLKDIYYAEHQLAKALPKMAQAAQDGDLKKAIESHLLETKLHAERLERVFQALGVPAKGETCEAIEGLIKEADDMVANSLTPDVLNAAIIAACQKVEHYEIASYGTIIEIAKTLGYKDQAKFLADTLKEEKHADESLSKLAEGGINEQARAA